MQCVYVVRGKRCQRKAAAGAEMCPYHVAWSKGPDAPDMWASRVSREARQLIHQAYDMQGLDDEIALLRLLILDNFVRGENEAARRAIEALARVLRTRKRAKRLDPASATDLDALLEQLGVESDD